MTDEYDRDLDGGPGQLSIDLDPEELEQLQSVHPDKSRTFRIIAWLDRNALKLVAGVGLTGFVLASFLGVQMPRNLRLIGVSAFVAMIFPGMPTARKVKSMLWDPSLKWIVDLDAKVSGGAIWRMPSARWLEWEVIGENDEVDWATPNLGFAKQIDPDDQTVEGVWRGTLTDREMMIALENVKRCRGTLEKRAQKGDVLEATGFIIVRNAISKVLAHVVETFEKGTLPDDGDALTDEIDTALESFGMSRSLDDLVDDDAESVDDVEEVDESLLDLGSEVDQDVNAGENGTVAGDD